MQQIAPIEIGIAVTNLDRMLEFYARVFSCVEERRHEIPVALSAPLTLAQNGYLCVWLATPHGERIKLMRPPAPPEPTVAADHLTTQSGLSFFTFHCSDLTETLALAEEMGATLRSDRILTQQGRPLRLCFLADPEGNVFELVERAPA